MAGTQSTTTGAAAAQPTIVQDVHFLKIFSHADRVDYGLMTVGTLGGIGNGLCLPFFYYVFARILQSFGESPKNPQKTADDVAKYALDLLYIGLVSLVCASAETACWIHTGHRQASKWGQAYLRAILRQNANSFNDTDGDLEKLAESISMNRVLVQEAISEKMGIFAYLLVTCIGGFGIAFFLLWKIGMVTLAFIPVVFVAYVLYAHLLSNQKYYGGTWAIVEEGIERIRTVYSCVYETKFVKSFAESIPLNLKYELVKGLGWGIVVAFNFFAFAFFLWYAGVLVRNSEVNGGKAISAIMAAFDGTNNLLHAIAITHAFSKGREAINSILEMINKPDAIVSKTASSLHQVKGDLELRGVEFNYPSRPNDRVILRGVSLRILPSQFVALVGDRGSGKSTVISLLQRFYDPVKGNITLDGTDIQSLDLGWYRGQIGLLNHEPVIFATSILENIRIGKNNATVEEVETAAKRANAHAFIMRLPNAYKTQVGILGVQLTDGQKQRVAIARTFLKDPKILLLDEPTCGLNATCERTVQPALEDLMADRGTLIIAQRLSTIQNASYIYVLQNGRVAEAGTHSQLYTQNEHGPYSELVRANEMATGGDGTVLGWTKRKVSNAMPGISSVCKNTMANGNSMEYPESNETKVNEEIGDDENVVEVKAERLPSEWQTFKLVVGRLAKMSTTLWPCLVLGSLGAILCGILFNPVFGYVLGKLLQVYYEEDTHKMRRDVQKYVLVYVGVGVVGVGMQMMQLYYLGLVAEMIAARVKETTFEGILKHEVGWFDLTDHCGKRLKDKLVSVTDSLYTLYPFSLGALLKSISCFVTAFIIGFVIDWRLSLVMLATFPLLVGSTMGQELCVIGFERVLNRSYPHSASMVEDLIRYIPTISTLNALQKIVAIFEQAFSKPAQRFLIRGNVSSLLFGVSYLTYYCTYGLLLWYGSTLVKHGTSDFGSVITVFMVITTSTSEIGGIIGPILWAIKSSTTLGSVFAITDRQTSIDPDDPSSEMVDSVTGTIDFVDVHFAYPTRPDVTVLKGLNLRVEAHQRVALVGAKGSGKSALLALVERFYDTNRGRVMIDGKDIQRLNLRSLRQHIGLVQSEPVLFNASIRENILCGRQNTEAEVQAAAEAADAHIFIEALQNGYIAEVGTPGVELNMGQRQRIVIARTKLKNPPILLIDDATLGMDSQQKKVVQEALDHLMLERTTIVVTHDLVNICSVVDIICVLEGGHIVEQGPHGDLMAAGGFYTRLFTMQRERERQRKPRP